MLVALRRDYPLALHGVGLGLGSADPLDRAHLARLARLVARTEPALVSEHLCWNRVGGRCLNDLLPLPYTDEALAHVCARVDAVQHALGRAIAVENVSSYLALDGAAIPEWEFVAEVARRTGCLLLVDVNNIHVAAHNHGFDALAYLDALPPAAVAEIHLAGHEVRGELLLDTHGARVAPEVWDLYRRALDRFGAQPTLVEWDTDLPALSVLLDEAATAQGMIDAARTQRSIDAAAPPRVIDAAAGDNTSPGAPAHAAGRASLPEHEGTSVFAPSPSTLRETQQRFADALIGTAAPDTNARIAIYRNAVFANYRRALRASYPVVARLVGPACFDATADAYARAVPSTCGDLNVYGGDFGDFLTRYPPATVLPYLADVARLEWAIDEAQRAADSPPFAPDAQEPRVDDGPHVPRDPSATRHPRDTDAAQAPSPVLAALARIAPEALPSVRLQLDPSCRLVASPHPILRIWQANQPAHDDAHVDLDAGGETLVVQREAEGIAIRRVPAADYAFLAAIASGATLAAAIDAASAVDAATAEAATADAGADAYATPAFDLEAALRTCLDAGLVVGIAPKPYAPASPAPESPTPTPAAPTHDIPTPPAPTPATATEAAPTDATP